MILSYLTHKKWPLISPGIKIIAMQSPIAYYDLVQAFQEKNQMLVCTDDHYDELEIAKTFDFVGDPILSGNVTKKYALTIVNKYLANLDDASRDHILQAFQALEAAIEDSLLLEDLPLEIDFTEDLKKLLKMVDLHINLSTFKKAYDIIEIVLKIHQCCNLKSIPVFCNVANYLEDDELQELASLAKQLNMMILLVEFTTPDLLVVPEEAEFYYIDRDLVDWY